MKKILLVAAIIVIASTAAASGGRPKKIENGNLFGSDDRQHGHHNTVTSPVPEPATLFLLGAGLIGLAAYARKK